MVHVVILRILVVLAIANIIASKLIIHPKRKDATLKSQITYGDLHHETFSKNVYHTSYAQHSPQVSSVQQPPIDDPRTYLKHHHTYTKPKSSATEIRFKKPDEKIVHHPSPIYVNRPPTFVTINHPDIVIEPSPVVYHKPAAVVRSPVIYKTLPRSVKYRNVVKHIVKPIEKKVVLEKGAHAKAGQYASKSQLFKPTIDSERQQVNFSNEESDTSNDAREIDVPVNSPTRVSRAMYRPPTDDWYRWRQEQKEIQESNELQGEMIDVNEPLNKSLELSHIYERKFQQNHIARFNLGQHATQTTHK